MVKILTDLVLLFRFCRFKAKQERKINRIFFPPYSRNMLCHFIVMENFRGTNKGRSYAKS